MSEAQPLGDKEIQQIQDILDGQVFLHEAYKKLLPYRDVGAQTKITVTWTHHAVERLLATIAERDGLIEKMTADLCICAEWDGQGISTCGLVCPVHGRQPQPEEA